VRRGRLAPDRPGACASEGEDAGATDLALIVTGIVTGLLLAAVLLIVALPSPLLVARLLALARNTRSLAEQQAVQMGNVCIAGDRVSPCRTNFNHGVS